jgi:single-strand DNA-binding protein
MNKVVLIGRFTKDPEIRNTGGGNAVTNFVLAVDRPFKNTNGEREADFISVVAWRQLAELICKYMAKGRQIAVEGRIQTRSYDNDEGKRVYVTEVVAENVKFLDRPRDGSEGEANTYNQGNGRPATSNNQPNRTQPENTSPFSGEEEGGNDIFSGLNF